MSPRSKALIAWAVALILSIPWEQVTQDIPFVHGFGEIVLLVVPVWLSVPWLRSLVGLPPRDSTASASLPNIPADPDKWHYDEASGEFFRITAHMPGGWVQFDTDAYSERLMDWWKTRRLARGYRVVMAVTALIALCGWLSAPLVGAIFLTIPFGVLCLFWLPIELNARAFEKRVGPKPIPPPPPSPPVAPHGATDAETI